MLYKGIQIHHDPFHFSYTTSVACFHSFHSSASFLFVVQGLLSQHLTQHLPSKSVSKRIGDGVANTVVGAPKKGSSAFANSSVVEHAVQTALGSVLGKDKRVEVFALTKVLADGGANRRVISLVVVGRSKVSGGIVDGTSEGVSWGERRESSGGGIDEIVSVGSGDHNLKLVAAVYKSTHATMTVSQVGYTYY
jgi:hypothetical protein